jgi:serine/threonine-protein kinase
MFKRLILGERGRNKQQQGGPMAGPRPGEVLNDRYELIDRIGGGSMGEVWRGRDLVLGRTVAVKIVLPALLDTPTFRQRFVAEARVMAMMDHPGIVRVYDYGYTDATDPDTPGAAFLVMEFIEGESLDRVLARTGPLEPRFAMKVLASLLDALAAVHRTGVVHRDVKPANVMLTSGGVVLADFGIARSEESLGLTAADALMGTVPYLAPELFRAEPPTPAADVYAVGILGYELLSGRQPFQAASTAAVMYMHMHEAPPPLPDYVAGPAADVLWHALEKDPAHRWADGAEMAAAVRHVLTGPVEAGEEPGGEPGPGGRYGAIAGNASGYEDTLTDSGGRRRRRPPVESGYAAPVGGYDDGWDGEGIAGDDPAEAGGRHGRAGALDETARLDVRADGTRVYDAIPSPLSDSVGRRGRAADLPDATRVWDAPIDPMADSGGRRAGGAHAGGQGGTHAGAHGGAHGATHHSASPPMRRRGAEPDQGPATGFGGRGGGLRPEMRRKALIAAAVAVPAVLGLSVALAMSSSGKSPDSGPAPGPAQQSDVPSSGSATDDLTQPTEPVPTSTSYSGHTGYSHHTYSTYPSSTRSSTYGSSSSATDPSTSGSRSDQSTGPSTTPSSSGGQPSATGSSSQAPSTPSSTAPSHPASSAS